MYKIANRELSQSYPPYIIAELSANHNGSIDRAKQSILAAKKSGAHAVKLQTYTADSMTIDCDRDDFKITGGLWDGYTLYQLYTEAHTPYEWHEELFRYAREIGITIFSSPFDETAIDLLQRLDAPAYKVASFELNDHPLIERIAETQKPILMSTGMASESEIGDAVEVARRSGIKNILLFHCISSYPAPLDQCNLNNMVYIKKTFNVEVGLSDHTLTNTAAISAVALGAVAIEKHFTMSRLEKGPDSTFSLEPDELSALVNDTRDAWLALGREEFSRPDAETANKAFRRSLYFVRDLPSGTTISKDDVRRIRPGFGLASKHYSEVIGKTVKRDIARGEPVKWSDLEI
ncbi:pseudaminic acid synthase [Thalassospira povalilytica]|uniref:Pseudaminic acid synthase n=2 Tax=Thalassospira TaxID=168934 RepID=A0ABX4R4K8_9PROT|nr:pseudaminic acid synthase [Thalassospira povalilytica]PKR47898.1 pseudaminic acid synthase [Thalassospira povalilytica]